MEKDIHMYWEECAGKNSISCHLTWKIPNIRATPEDLSRALFFVHSLWSLSRWAFISVYPASFAHARTGRHTLDMTVKGSRCKRLCKRQGPANPSSSILKTFLRDQDYPKKTKKVVRSPLLYLDVFFECCTLFQMMWPGAQVGQFRKQNSFKKGLSYAAPPRIC